LQSPVGVGGNRSNGGQSIAPVGFPYRIAILEGNRIQTYLTGQHSEATLKHRWDTTSINTGGQRGG
jgi:hypothetical protein